MILSTEIAVVFVLLYNFQVSRQTLTTSEGCNVTIFCTLGTSQSSLANGLTVWTHVATGQRLNDSRFVTSDWKTYSTLTIQQVKLSDGGNYTCSINRQHVTTLVIEPECTNLHNHDDCVRSVENGNKCLDTWIRKNCRKACGLCPKCTETVLPTDPLPFSKETNSTVVTIATRAPSSTTADTGFNRTVSCSASLLLPPIEILHRIVIAFLLFLTFSEMILCV